MTREQQLSPDQNDELSDQIMQLLRDRIELSKRDQLLDYLDFLIPRYELPDNSVGQTANTRRDYDWSEFLDLYGEDFVRNAYLCIVKREADADALQAAITQLGEDECSRIIFLWQLRDSDEGRGQATKIRGLWVRYRFWLACVEQKTLSRRFFGLLMKLEKLSRRRIEKVLVSQRCEIAACSREISRLEMRLMQHYNDTLTHVKHEVGEALTANINHKIGR